MVKPTPWMKTTPLVFGDGEELYATHRRAAVKEAEKLDRLLRRQLTYRGT
ncbi:MAG: hypothetical protein OXN89_06570 [Bryobacterales bacterium]|nr:hypothetical protein [Bryobacterales bacterium]